ncbi:MAG: BMC domain-containing protein [Phycisphaerales bacterium]|nr:BMC domain-containing protein [Phycisphaerales bacterium]
MNPTPAIAMYEFDSVADGTRVADRMIKQAPLTLFRAGTTHPGKYLLLVGGEVGAVEVADAVARREPAGVLGDAIFLPDAHHKLQAALWGRRVSAEADTLAVLECPAMPALVGGVDRAVKTAPIEIVDLRLGDALGGRGVAQFCGVQADIEASIEAALRTMSPRHTAKHAIIPRRADALRACLDQSSEFGSCSSGV